MNPRAEELIQQACDRVDRFEHRIRALLPEPDRRSRLLADADHLDRALQPFLMGVKDIINADGFSTQAGSSLPPELFEGPEATVVTRLKAAGALVLAKTTTTEFAFSDPAPTANPRNELHTPGGSSSGSAAAVAAGYLPIAVGTQTVDSIVTPAAYCGIVGFKPSFGRIPTDGVLPFSTAMDTVGFLAKDLETAASGAEIAFDKWRGVGMGERLTIGIPSPTFLEHADSQSRAAFEKAVTRLEAANCEIVRTDSFRDITAIAARHRRLIAAQFTSVHRQWYAEYGDRYRPRSTALFEEGEALGQEAVTQGLLSSSRLRTELEQAMDDQGIEVWISPSATGPAPLGLKSIGDPIMGLPWTHAHMPVVSLPTGSADDGLPLGIQLTGRYGNDEELLGFVAQIAPMLAHEAVSR